MFQSQIDICPFCFSPYYEDTEPKLRYSGMVLTLCQDCVFPISHIQSEGVMLLLQNYYLLLIGRKTNYNLIWLQYIPIKIKQVPAINFDLPIHCRINQVVNIEMSIAGS